MVQMQPSKPMFLTTGSTWEKGRPVKKTAMWPLFCSELIAVATPAGEHFLWK